ncbi:hypothetical protein SCWH03_08140 [Streptomyces pacificus]|uniref:Uncharacterized protein n=1 Tax=Streptomyces pacificus TaxID=2705029 RepID=A0A6A0ANQ8_9ACTN|nr:hypothetical protein SCWH03_08140 [Streptomyces pacificus]
MSSGPFPGERRPATGDPVRAPVVRWLHLLPVVRARRARPSCAPVVRVWRLRRPGPSSGSHPPRAEPGRALDREAAEPPVPRRYTASPRRRSVPPGSAFE